MVIRKEILEFHCDAEDCKRQLEIEYQPTISLSFELRIKGWSGGRRGPHFCPLHQPE